MLHWDDNKKNNNYRNLRYGTASQNGADGRRNDKYSRSETHHAAKFSNKDISEIKDLKGFVSQAEITMTYGVSKRYVYQIWSGESRQKA